MELRVLTLYQPWAHAVAQGQKTVENRKWHPPRAWVGQSDVWLALHAGKTYDPEGERMLKEWGVAHPAKDKLDYAAILGVARLAGVVTNQAYREKDKMFFGPFGWLLDHITLLPAPIALKGAMGVVRPPQEIDAQLRFFIAQIPKQAMPPITSDYYTQQNLIG